MLQAAQQAPRADRAAGRADAPGGGVRDRPGRSGARRGGAAPGAGRAARGRRGAGLPGSHLRPPGDLRSAGRGAAPAHRHHRRLHASWWRLHLRLGRVLADVLDEPGRGHRQLPGGAGAGHAATPRRWRRSSGCTSAASAGKSCTASTSRCSTSPRATRRWPTATRAWPASAREVLRATGRRRSSCGARCSTCAGADPVALGALADLHEQAGEWRELTEVLDNQIRATAAPHGSHPAVQAAGAHLGREAAARAQRARVLAAGAGDRPQRRRGPAGHRRQLPDRRAPGRSCPTPCSRLIDLGTDGPGRRGAEGAVLAAGRAGGRDPACAPTGPSTPGARCWSSIRRTSARWRRWRRCTRRRGAGRSASRCWSGGRAALASPEDQIDVLMQVANIWVDKIGDGGAAAEVYERILAHRSRQHDGLDRGRAALPAAQELDQADRAAAVAHRVPGRPQGAHPAAGADRRDLRAAAGRSRQRLRDPAGGLPRGLLQRPRGQGAGAAGHRGRQVERAALGLHPGGPDHPRPASRRPTCG